MKIGQWWKNTIIRLAKAYHPRLTELDVTSPGWSVGSGQDLRGNIEAIRHTFWAYICISKITRSIAGLPMKFYQGYEDQKRRIYKGDIVDMIHRPNFEDTHRELFLDTIGFLLGTGTAYWALDQVSVLTGRPVTGRTSIWTLPAHRVEIVPSTGDLSRRIASYDVVSNTGKKVSYSPDQIVQFKMLNLENQYYGLAPLTVAMRSMETDFYARRHNRLFFKNGASPGLHLKTEQRYDKAAEERILESVRNRWGGEDSHSVMISWSGLEPVEENRGPKDLDFVNLIKLNREEIIALFGVPPAEVGLFEYANYANAMAQKKQYWMETIIPLLQLIEVRLNEREFPKWTDKEIWFKFDLDNVEALQDDRLEKAKVSVMLHNSGLFTANEIRNEHYDAEPIEGGDELKKPSPSLAVSNESASLKAFDDPSDLWFKKDITRRKSERKFIDEMKQYFNGETERILKKLAEYPEEQDVQLDDIDQIINELDEQVILEKATKSIFIEAVFSSGQLAVEEVAPKKSKIVKQDGDIYVGDFDVTSPEVSSWIENKVAKFVTRVGESTKAKIRDVVNEAYNNGWTVRQLGDELSSRLNQSIFSGARALTIAQTEMGAATNAGTIMGYRQSGVVHKKVWLSARDIVVRLSHAAAEAEGPIPLNQKFANGLGQPGDPAGLPEEVINCRCSLAAEIEIVEE